ncbi:hypothetical protein Acr_15g0002020 [Actinidia rufa]|uniref:Uncharacterized protein n=1 Tax=Actinidia rufa TaxID=165716 RepID=A0A7J0FSE2_9ERIC|nr:hypothetical protein Acr_15g0002020 [Actinidia rufa]
MEQEPDPNPSSSEAIEDSPSSSQVQEEPEEIHPLIQVEDHQHPLSHYPRPPGRSYRLNISISNVPSTQIRDDAWSCLIVLVTFWLFGLSQLSTNFTFPFAKKERFRLMFCSIVFHEAVFELKIGWSEKKREKEWEYFLNKGSKVDISYSVKSPSSCPLSLVIAQGSGIIHLEILRSKMYYIAVSNLNSEEVEVQLNFTIKGLLYNTTQAYYKCSMSHRLCNLKLFLLRANAAVLTSPGIEQGMPYDDWFVKLSYGPRWITYFCRIRYDGCNHLVGLQVGVHPMILSPMTRRKLMSGLRWLPSSMESHQTRGKPIAVAVFALYALMHPETAFFFRVATALSVLHVDQGLYSIFTILQNFVPSICDPKFQYLIP